MWQADGTKFQDATNYLSVNSFTYPRFSGVQHSSDGQKSPSGGNMEYRDTLPHTQKYVMQRPKRLISGNLCCFSSHCHLFMHLHVCGLCCIWMWIQHELCILSTRVAPPLPIFYFVVYSLPFYIPVKSLVLFPELKKNNSRFFRQIQAAHF